MSEIMSVGEFHGRVVHIDLSESSKKGTPCVEATLSAVGGDEDGNTSIWQGWLTDGAIKNTIKRLRVMGWKGDDLSDLSTCGSKDFTFTVEENVDDKGRVHFRVGFINDPGSAPSISSVMSAEKKKRFAEQMRGRVIAESGGASTVPGTRPGPDGASLPPPDDEIPF